MANKGTEQLIIGSLMRNPSVLLQKDKYNLTIKDFDLSLYQYAFYAIYNILHAGGVAEEISVATIENWLGEESRGKDVYNATTGRQTLIDALEKARNVSSNFDSEYLRLKKENLLRDLKKANFNTEEFLVEEAKTDDEKILNDAFNSLTPQDILGSIEEKLIRLRRDYAAGDSSESQTLYEGLEDLILNLEEFPEVGYSLQGDLFNFIVGGAQKGTFHLRSGSSGLGKALPNSRLIPTPQGWKKVGDIRKGDYLFDRSGRITQVLEVFPQGLKDVCRITLSDGRTAYSCMEHLWSYYDNEDNPSILKTSTLLDIARKGLKTGADEYRIMLPNNGPVQYPEKHLTFAPIEFGKLLGDSIVNRYVIKHIPRQFLEGSINQRKELLDSFIANCPSITKKDDCFYLYISTDSLCQDIVELCQSLGVTVTVEKTLATNKIKIELKRNERVAIVAIKKLFRQEQMTCFLVDNEEHLFLTENFIVTHNTRSTIGDACHLAFPLRYSWDNREWVKIGESQKVLVVITEQSIEEVQKMAVAYITGINERIIKKGLMHDDQKKIIRQGFEIFKEYESNFHIVKIPSPSIGLVKQRIRELVTLHQTDYVFYDYIFESPALFAEFQGIPLRTDQMLFMFSDALKSLAVELDVFIMSSTQVNAKSDSSKDIRNEASIAGSRAIINKADVGCIMARPSAEELKTLEAFYQKYKFAPNVVTDIYKLRGDAWSQVRIWSFFDLGILRKTDLFVTNSRLEVITLEKLEFERIGLAMSKEEVERRDKTLERLVHYDKQK